MGFHLKASNSLEALSVGLCEDMNQYKGDVFRAQFIVTQTEGMNDWLGQRLAQQQGIAAGLQYLKPNDLIFRIYYLLGGGAEATISSENLTWLLYSLLGTEAFTGRFEKVARYYKSSDDQDGEVAKVKRLGLAKKVADLFDQYQIYRSDMIKTWNEGSPGPQELEAWQYYLWEQARLKAGQVAGKSFADKHQVADFIEEALKEPATSNYLQGKMPAVYFFGISLLTEFHLHIFDLLAAKIDIYFYLLNPAPSDYWFDDLSEKRLAFLRKLGRVDPAEQPQGHPLLQSMGKVIKDTFTMLFKKDEMLNAYESLAEIYPTEDSLLHQLQVSIYENRTPVQGTFTFESQSLQDDSLSVHACYSPLREVESLYNFLVYLIDQKREALSPRDIVVMVSDIDHYAAYIRAVFDHATYKFPYRIADESFTDADSITSALESILTLDADTFTAEAVLRLLDSSFIRRHWGITRIDLLRRVLDAAAIRFGIEGSYTDDSVYVSWRYGLQRIMYGIAMIGDGQMGDGPEGFYPLDMVEGSDSEEVIRFVAFVEALITMLEDRKKDRTLVGWSTFVKELLDQFILSEELQGEEEFDYLASTLADYNTAEVFLEDRVEFSVFMESFRERLVHATRKGNFAAGGVTFCSLIPMRSIPFRVVALLGLDYDKFPRKEQSLGFDLMERNRRPGDRNVKANDKHLFLETLLSARDYLYISYIGRSIKDNSDIPPSALVDELIDYVASQSDNPNLVREKMVVRHSLLRFTEGPEVRFPNYLQLVASPEKEKGEAQLAVTEDQPVIREVAVKELIRFLQHPIKGYLNQVAGVYYDQRSEVLKEEEVFELDALQRYNYRDLLLVTDDDCWDELRDKGVKTGQLPLKNSSRLAMNSLAEDVRPVKDMLEGEITGLSPVEVPLFYQWEGMELTGKSTIYGNKLIVVSWSKYESKAVLGGYLQYLLLRASEVDVVFKVISFRNNQLYTAKPLDAHQAGKSIESLLNVYRQAEQSMIPFVLGLDKDPGKLDFDKWKGRIHEKTQGDYVDEYINKAYEMGIFTPEGFDRYQEMIQVLDVPLMELFEDFPMVPQ